ncbi:amidohydrolase [Maribacter sp. HTCC2170]|uniref:amidohydrolase n=1 Tax=Maribacter sp. (strain HTCC2170 / KCCM 42371) TaxID=313603 RepID=UPI00006BD5A4|nr:amidohydrolase [Maribacter sp. HTCC2170]EAR03062.1 putative amidohydrolase [Maribacter sp. HTCC2170]
MKNQKLNIALVQTSLVWEDPEENRENLSNKIDKLPFETDLIVLPEMFITGFTMNPQNIDDSEGPKTVEWMLDEAKKAQSAIVGSIPFFENGFYVNRLYFVEPNGTIYHYDKRHTFTLAGEDQVYKAGNKHLIIDYKAFRINPMICYDLRFPVWARNTEDYDVLIYVANWPKPRVTAWDTLLKARAIENMAYCIGVNRCGQDEAGYVYSGHSALYNSLGEQLVFSEEETVLFATLDKAHIVNTRNKLKFLEDRDTFSLKL